MHVDHIHPSIHLCHDQPELPRCPSELNPEAWWERETLASFANIRLELSRRGGVGGGPRNVPVPPRKNVEDWKKFFFGREEGEEEKEGEEGVFSR